MKYPDHPDYVPVKLDHREALGATVAVALVVAAALGWFFLFVQPHDEFLGQVMDCMGNDGSEAAYRACAAEISSASVRNTTPRTSL